MTSISIKAALQYEVGGSTYPGVAVLEGEGNVESRVTLTLPINSRTEVRSGIAGVWAGDDMQNHAMATHNCLTTPMWFSPHLFLQTVMADPAYGISYIGAESQLGVPVQHLRIARTDVLGGSDLGMKLSSTDIFLDATTYLPTSIRFMQHQDENALFDMPTEIQFSGYLASGGVIYPSHIVKLFEGSVLFDFSVSSIAVNPNIPASDFSF